MRTDPRHLRRLTRCAGLALAALTTANAPAATTGIAAQPVGLAATELPTDPVAGPIAMSSRRAWAWTEGDGPATSRLMLDGDVVIELGGYRFECRRAAVWMAPVPDDPGAFRVFAELFEVGSPAAAAAVAFEADRLPVHGVVRTSAGPALSAPLVAPGPPTDRDLLADLNDAERSYGSFLARITPARVVLPPTDLLAGDEPLAVDPDASEADLLANDPGELPTSPIFEADGTLFIAPGDTITAQSGRDVNTITLTGGVAIQYAGPTRSLEITARRAVVFLRPGPLQETLTRVDVSDVLGLYLEGGVIATDGKATIRGPRVYYDLPSDRALMLDAVFRTYDARLRMPLYMRAAAIRQEAANQFSADRAMVANTAFARPHLALGTTSVTIERRERADGSARTHVDARGVRPRFNGVPFFYLPQFEGDPERIPLRNIGFEDSNRQGAVYRTAWDPFVLLGIETPPGVDSGLLVDYYSERGFALGTETTWSGEGYRGEAFGYIVFDDTGEDFLGNGTEIPRDGETRAAIVARHQLEISELWRLTLEGAHFSDEAFVPAFFPEIGRREIELTNRVSLRRLEDNRLVIAQVEAASNDFPVLEHELQAPGYRVDRLPELEARGFAEDLTQFFDPGLISYAWDASVSSMRLRFTEITPSQLGINNDRLLGVDPDDPVASAFRSAGLNEDIVNRFDTRHEVSVVLDEGPVSITPFLTGRFTAYDTDFASFSPDESDNARLWGSAGIRLGTSFFRVDESVESRTLDLHRMRHIIEPSVTLWHGASTVAADDLPVYDDDVESLAEGNAARFELAQTWQTKRGGPGRWRDVDVFGLTLGATWAEREADRGAQVPRWYDARPELSSTRNAFDAQAVWQASEAVALAGEWIYDVEASQAARSSIGVLVDHGRGLAMSAELRSLREQGDTYGDVAGSYYLSEKYYAEGRVSYNFRRDEVATSSVTILRGFPNGELGVAIVYNNISSETSFGFVFRPTGIRGFGVQTGNSRRPSQSRFGG